MPLDATAGLNKELTEFKRFWDAGHLAVVQGVGYPNPDLSHFNSMATWMSGIPNGIPSSGWMGRWLDGYLGSTKNLFAAAEIGHSLPLHLVGRVQRGTTVPAGRPAFGADTSAQSQKIYSSLRTISAPNATTWKGRIGQAMVDQLDVARTLRPVIPDDVAGGRADGPARGDGPADQRQPRVPGVDRGVGRLRQPCQRADDAHRLGWPSSTPR